MEICSKSSCVTTTYTMTDIKKEADTNAIDCNITQDNIRTEAVGSQIISMVAHGDTVVIETF